MSQRRPYPSETAERFIVRLPDGMRDQLAEQAKANGRSMNAEIVSRLQASLDDRINSDELRTFLRQQIESAVEQITKENGRTK